MPDNALNAILKELEDAEASLKAQVEKLFGKIETTDFADEYQALCNVHDKLQALVAQVAEPDSTAPPAV